MLKLHLKHAFYLVLLFVLFSCIKKNCGVFKYSSEMDISVSNDNTVNIDSIHIVYNDVAQKENSSENIHLTGFADSSIKIHSREEQIENNYFVSIKKDGSKSSVYNMKRGVKDDPKKKNRVFFIIAMIFLGLAALVLIILAFLVFSLLMMAGGPLSGFSDEFNKFIRSTLLVVLFLTILGSISYLFHRL